ncbi:unnamed protein product, partial [Hapterophycus canaliculatus]
RNTNAAAVLRRQAGFRFDYAAPLRQDRNKEHDDEEVDDKESFANDIVYALLEHVSNICSEVDLRFHHVGDWMDGVTFEIFNSLEHAFDGPDYLPLTGRIDFADALQAYKKLK